MKLLFGMGLLLMATLTSGQPLTIDKINQQVILTGMIKPGNYNHLFSFPKHHHFIVSKNGSAAGKALIQVDADDLEIQKALESLGGIAGNNLTTQTWTERGDSKSSEARKQTRGSLVNVYVVIGSDTLKTHQVLKDGYGNGFEFRFGGHAHLRDTWQSGCVVCLESCPGGRISNARYTMRDFEEGHAEFDFRLKDKIEDDLPVKVILKLEAGK